MDEDMQLPDPNQIPAQESYVINADITAYGSDQWNGI